MAEDADSFQRQPLVHDVHHLRTFERGYSSAEVHRMFHRQAWPAQTHYLADAAARVDLILPMDWGEADVERCLRRFRTAAEAKGHP